MKAFICFALLACSIQMWAQKPVTHPSVIPYIPPRTSMHCFTHCVAIRLPELPNSLLRLPQRNINAIAGLQAGVDSRAGNTPNILGARPEGTAYFVDGVRVLDVAYYDTKHQKLNKAR